uniref:Uncharacterized protein n=1 Tax=Coccidioides posadasii RMSCC 3488 TaxID=454284 RepID=A0A0J6FET6_COCPO|nr:hypothetical protein CPAG_07949 [Coccidioides posadasii RMSCC 3488]
MLQSLSLDGAGLLIEHRRCDRPRPIGWAAAQISQVTVLGLSGQSQRCFGRPRSAFSAATIAESLRAAAARAFGGRSNHAGPLLGVWGSRGSFTGWAMNDVSRIELLVMASTSVIPSAGDR